MIQVAGTKVTIDRGDDGTLRWSVTDLASVVTNIESASFKFTVRHRTVDASPAVTLESLGISSFAISISSPAGGIVDVSLLSTITAALSPGTYRYDFQMTNYGRIYTLVKGIFVVTEDVTR